MRHALLLLPLLALPAAAAAQGGVAAFAVVGDAIPAPLEGRVGDAARGAAVARDRAGANCLICHAIPDPREAFMGDVGPPLAGVGARLTAGQIRLRLVDASRVNPESVMPPYHRVDGLIRVDPRWRGRPVLEAQAIEDLVAWLVTLVEE